MQKQTAAILALILVLFLDGFGQGVMYPVLATALEATNSNVLVAGVSLSSREMLYGVTLAIYFFTWFFGAAILGDISDNVGRRKALVVVLVGMALGNVLSALAFVYHDIWLLFLGRLVVGFTAGSQAIAQASMADISPPEKQARNTAFVLFGVTFGFVIGPLAGGLLANSNLVSWFGDDIPFYLTGLLSLINIFLLLLFYNDTNEKLEKHKVKLSRAVMVFVEAFHHKKVRKLVVQFFLLQFGWAVYILQLPTLLIQTTHATLGDITWVMTFLGIGMSFSLIVIVPRVEKWKITMPQVIVGSYFVLAILITLSLVTLWLPLLVIYAVLAGMVCATGYTFTIKLFSSHADKERQGWINGIMNSDMVLATGVSTLVSGLLFSVDLYLPFYLGIIAILISVVWIPISERQTK